MKNLKYALLTAIFFAQNASAWVIDGNHTIEKLGINPNQVNIIVSNRDGIGCFLTEDHPRYKELVSLIHTLYASGKSGYFRCSEKRRNYSPWEPEVSVYELLELTGNK